MPRGARSRRDTRQVYDAAIVGGGPAGLSAALVLGRSRRSVALCDAGAPRNAASRTSHGFFTRDGETPQQLLRLGRVQLEPYDVAVIDATATAVQRRSESFTVHLSSGRELRCSKLLLATGLCDELPSLHGIEALYGKSVFHCPFCDAWELRDEPIAAYGAGAEGTDYALGLTSWSDDVVLCTDGRPVAAQQRRLLERNGVALRRERIAALEGEDGLLRSIVFRSGDRLPRRALFFTLGTAQRSRLPRQLGVELDARGAAITNRFGETRVPGLYVAGDASRDVNSIAVAVAEGFKAAVDMHRSLRKASTG